MWPGADGGLNTGVGTGDAWSHGSGLRRGLCGSITNLTVTGRCSAAYLSLDACARVKRCTKNVYAARHDYEDNSRT